MFLHKGKRLKNSHAGADLFSNYTKLSWLHVKLEKKIKFVESAATLQ